MEYSPIGFIEDKNGKKYKVTYRTRKRNDVNRHYFKIFNEAEHVGTFEYDEYDGEHYAIVDYAEVEYKYQNKGIYNSFLIFSKNFFKKQGLKGIFSLGTHRNLSSDAVWSKLKGATFVETTPDEMGYKYKNYTFERLKSFESFSKDQSIEN